MTSSTGTVIEPLANLKLDRRLLTFILIGAGFGESILVALPGSEGWIVIDGAAPDKEPPAMTLLQRHWSNASSIELLLLTHPHADHYAGFIKLLDDKKLGPAVKRIGCVSHYLGVSGGNVLGREVKALFEAIDIDDAEGWSALGRARNALERIRDEWLKHPERIWQAVRGKRLAFDNDVSLRVLGPELAHVAAFFKAPDLARRIHEQANDLSVVLELHFGVTRLLLGGDLPNERNGETVTSGWSHLCGTIPGLRGHTGYKVAHHASKEAIHLDVVSAQSHARAWATTPYNKGEKLPRFESGNGVSQLHLHESELLLTALPVGIRDQTPMPERVRRADLEPARVTTRGPLGRLGAAVADGPAWKSPPTECAWALQFDDRGNTVARYRGDVATMIV